MNTLTEIHQISLNYCRTHSLGDDLMFACAAAGIPELGEHIIKTVYKIPDLKLKKFLTQYPLKTFPKYHQVILDGIGIDQDGNVWSIEIQNRHTAPSYCFARWQYISAEIETHLLLAGQGYDHLTAIRATIITKDDYFQRNKPLYTVRLMIPELNYEPVVTLPNAKSGEVMFKFAGANVSGNSPETLLAQSLFETDLQKITDLVVKKALQFMRSEEGAKGMDKIIQDFLNKSNSEAKAAGIETGIEIGKRQGIEEGENIMIKKFQKALSASGISPELIQSVVAEVKAGQIS